MKSRSPAISVIIPTFNRVAMLADTLESFAVQSIPKNRYEVVVVDDGSKDATSEVCRDFASPIQLKYLHIENSGISAAKNTGILASRGRILLFCDDDDIADSHLLEEHLKAHKQYPQESVAILGYTTWAPTLSVTPLMRYVTDIGRFLPNTAFLTAISEPQFRKINGYDVMDIFLPYGWVYYEMESH